MRRQAWGCGVTVPLCVARFAGHGMRDIIDLACTVCKQRNYTTRKNKKNDPDRLERNKFCKFCRKHSAHKEVK